MSTKISLSALLLLCACPMPREGFPLEESSSSGGDDEDDGETISVSSTITTSASDPTTDPSGSMSDGTTLVSSSDGSESSSSSEESGSESESGSDDASTSSTGEPSGQPTEGTYAPCTYENQDACGGETCIWTDGLDEGISPTGWCSEKCNGPSDCPAAPPDSDAVVQCTYYGEGVKNLHCMLLCPNGETCPEGMACLESMQLPEVDGFYSFVCTTAWSE